MSDLFDKSIRTLELPRVLELLSEQAVSAEARQRALRLRPETEVVCWTRPMRPEISSACGAARPFPA